MSASISDFDRARTVARRLGDRHLEGLALAYRGWAEGWNRDFDTSEVTTRAALLIGDEGFEDVRLFAHVCLAMFLYSINRLADAKEFLQAAEELADRVDDPFGHFWWSIVGWHLPAWEGRFDDTIEHLEHWRATVEASGNAFGILADRWLEAVVRGGKGDYDRALSLLYETLGTAERIGEVFWRARALNTIGWIYGQLQDVEQAMEWNQRGVEAAVAGNDTDPMVPMVESNARLNLGDNLMALGRLDEAEEQFQKVEIVARDPKPQDRLGLWRYSQHLFHSYGEMWLARGDSVKALAYADECMALAEPGNSRKYVAMGRRLRAQALIEQGELVAAESELDTALEAALAVGNPPQLWRTYVAIGSLCEAQGRRAVARKAYVEALSVIDEVAAGLSDESLRSVLLASDHVQSIRRAAAVAG